MINRRTLTTSGFAALLTLPMARTFVYAGQSTEAASPFSAAVLQQNLPELPAAPEGELAVVMQSLSNGAFVSAIYHNATDAAVRVTEVSAAAADAAGNDVDETSYGPINLESGQYGIAVFEFDDDLADGTEVEVTLSTEDDADLVDINVTQAEAAEAAGVMNFTMRVENPHDFDVDDVVIAAIFFTPEGEILNALATGARMGLEAGDSWNQTFGQPGLKVSDSFVVAASGKNDS